VTKRKKKRFFLFKNLSQIFCLLLVAFILSSSIIKFLIEGISLIFFLYCFIAFTLILVVGILGIEKINGNKNRGTFNLPPRDGLNPPISLDVSHPKKYLIFL